MNRLLLVLLLIVSNVNAQQAQNLLLGNFTTNCSSSYYRSLTFDNNGKLNIDASIAEYFIIGDTLIAFQDKDLFKFIIKGDSLYGVSEWVKDIVWNKTQEAVEDKRINHQRATENAELLHEYYLKTRLNINQIEQISDRNKFEQYQSVLESLCNRNLIRACKEYFATLSLERMNEIKNASSDSTVKELTPNPEMLKIIEKVKSMDADEGNFLEANYLIMTGQTEAGEKILIDLVNSGNIQAASYFYSLKDDREIDIEGVGFEYESQKIFDLATLRLLYGMSLDEAVSILKSDYAYRKIGQREDLNGTIINEFENDWLESISKFEGRGSNSNLSYIEYCTVNIDQFNAILEELKKENYSIISQGSNYSGKFTDYKKTVIFDGKSQDYYVTIYTPEDEDSEEPICIVIF
jgi:hypothetical protein